MTTTPDDDDPRLSSGAYSLDAVSREEVEAFEKAADASPSLRDEADGLVETAGLLGLAATPVAPSARLKADLMAKLAGTPQLPALPDAGAPDASAPDASAPDAQNTPVPDAAAPLVPAPAAAEAASAPDGPAAARARTRWFARPIGVVAAVAAAAALFVGGGVVGTALSGGLGSTAVVDAASSDLARITAAADSQRASVPVEGGGTATVVWSNSLGRSAVLADGLPPLPDGKVYEAWYIRSQGAIPAGTFAAADDSTSWHVLAGAMSAGDTVGVTVEPAGGSKTPTTTPIIVAPTA